MDTEPNYENIKILPPNASETSNTIAPTCEFRFNSSGSCELPTLQAITS